jgi:Ca2+-binding EF-hand superfamily protein
MYASFKKNAEKRNEPLTNDELAFLAGLPVHQISEFREIFRLVDSNNSGTIDATELQQLMASLHFDDVLVNDKYYSDLISRVHARQKNSDDLEEFSVLFLFFCHNY